MMGSEPYTSSVGYRGSLRILAAAACLWPAIAGAQPPNPTVSDPSGNTAAGTDALLVVTGSGNTAIGRDALRSNSTGSVNTASGRDALRSNNTGSGNTASGADALRNNTTGILNTANGRSALYSNTTGDRNTASGFQALALNTTGVFNTASGVNALFSNTTGRNNTAIGAGALVNMNGVNNIAVGFDAGSKTTSGNHNIYIGHPGINGSESRVIRIGRNQTKVFVRGISGVPVSGAAVVVRSNGQLGVVASSARYKQDIRPLGDASDKLARLRPVSYRYKTEPEAMHYGLIAEEVDKVMPELVVRDDRGRAESVQYIELIPLMLQQWKAQQAENKQLRELIERQEARLDRQAVELAKLRNARLAGNTDQRN